MPNLVTQTVYSLHHCIATAATTDGEKFHLHPARNTKDRLSTGFKKRILTQFDGFFSSGIYEISGATSGCFISTSLFTSILELVKSGKLSQCGKGNHNS